jgi:hypothetical protein
MWRKISLCSRRYKIAAKIFPTKALVYKIPPSPAALFPFESANVSGAAETKSAIKRKNRRERKKRQAWYLAILKNASIKQNDFKAGPYNTIRNRIVLVTAGLSWKSGSAGEIAKQSLLMHARVMGWGEGRGETQLGSNILLEKSFATALLCVVADGGKRL